VNRDWSFSRDIKTVSSSLTSVAIMMAVARKGAIDGVDCGSRERNSTLREGFIIGGYILASMLLSSQFARHL
jgi:hypothetical protein